MRVFGFAAFSGTGKTTLIERLIPLLTQSGLRISVVKHAHHNFDVDRPGKDSYRYREAGATEVMVSSRGRWVLMHELRDEPESELNEQLARLSPCDLVLVEGFKMQPIPKIELYREAMKAPLLFPNDPNIVAIAADTPLKSRLPQFDINDIEGIAGFILRHVGLKQPTMLAQAESLKSGTATEVK